MAQRPQAPRQGNVASTAAVLLLASLFAAPAIAASDRGILCDRDQGATLDIARHDLTVVSFHWGAEKHTTPRLYQMTYGRSAIDYGADLVLGHHPHVLQGLELYKGKQPRGHMQNFFDCMEDRSDPISDVYTHHRTMTSCHLCNITLMLGRKLQWDPDKEDFVNDEQASALMSRPSRSQYLA